MKIKALFIVEDLKVRSTLTSMIQNYFNEVTIIGKYFENQKIVESVNKYAPDFVFCELDIASTNPFDLIASLPLSPTSFIFIGESNNTLSKAVKFAALNFLDKEFSLKDLKKVMKKLISNFRENLKTAKQISDNKISLSTNNGYYLVNLSEIEYIGSSRNYCTVCLRNGEKITLTKLIGDFEKLLSANDFFRVHQSYIVNLKYITKVINKDGDQVILKSGFKIPVARRRKKVFLMKLGIHKDRYGTQEM